MKFKIPFTFSKTETLKRKSKRFIRFIRPKKTRLDDYLQNSEEDLESRQYLSICLRNFLFNFSILTIISTSILGIFRAKYFYYFGLGSALLVSLFLFLIQRNYPKIFALKKERNIEKNLIPVLQDIMVQLNSGIPMFRIMSNIADSDYGEVSKEFKKITKEINSGMPQIDTLEKYGEQNTSKYFRRILWQISNGLRAGSDMGIVIKEGIRSLNNEQAIQIQTYGGQLNPLVMFYMLIAVILPSLGLTFLIILSAILNMSEKIIQLIFFLVFGFVIFMQIMFLGLIKSRRPSLL